MLSSALYEASFTLSGTVQFSTGRYARYPKVWLVFPLLTELLLGAAHHKGALAIFSPGEKNFTCINQKNSCAFYSD